jgi:hypothetical protein
MPGWVDLFEDHSRRISGVTPLVSELTSTGATVARAGYSSGRRAGTTLEAINPCGKALSSEAWDSMWARRRFSLLGSISNCVPESVLRAQAAWFHAVPVGLLGHLRELSASMMSVRPRVLMISPQRRRRRA